MSEGIIIAIIGAGLCAILSSIGSAIGVQMGGRAAAGVCSEKPELFGKVLLLQALPGTQGFYGFIVAVLVANNLGFFSGNIAQLTMGEGWAYFGAVMPATIILFVSAIYQAMTGVAAIHMTAKQPDASGRGVTMTALVETYAILGLLTSIIIIFGLR
ncbi:MAG: V-type ATP synthase subunit K [Bacilli bacterium]|nr:V-type ATP synthase subunit K [Bacilli bacterium]